MRSVNVVVDGDDHYSYDGVLYLEGILPPNTLVTPPVKLYHHQEDQLKEEELKLPLKQ